MSRITLFCGHYGSGKTNIAINYAVRLRREGTAVTLFDLDIVNPYYRSKDSSDLLRQEGIELVASDYANTNVDTPALPGDMYRVTDETDRFAVVDVGGDDRGALALGRLTPAIIAEGDYDMLFVCNFMRPLTRTPEEALGVMREIEAACGIPFTGIVNNTNLGKDTVRSDIDRSKEKIEHLCEESGLPLRFTCAESGIARKNELALTLQKTIW